jgi:hypothetical protein
MTPKDKAMELMLKYYKLIPMNTVSFSKQCAIIAVELLLQYDNYQGKRVFIYENNDEIIRTEYSKYWKEVKQYITEL